MENDIIWSEIGSEFGESCGTTPLIKMKQLHADETELQRQSYKDILVIMQNFKKATLLWEA